MATKAHMKCGAVHCWVTPGYKSAWGYVCDRLKGHNGKHQCTISWANGYQWEGPQARQAPHSGGAQ